ncbi:MAG: OsmC family protein [Bacteroidota bacterium]
METAKIIYLGDLRTEATHLASNNKIITDAPIDNHGKGEAFSPTDLLCSSLASCMLTIMGITANTHNINITNTEIKATKIMANDPRRVIEIIIEMNFPTNSYSDKEKQMLINAAKTCPVAKSLHPDIKQTISFNF